MYSMIAVLVIAVGIGVYIDRSAVARVEFSRISEAIKIKDKSIKDVTSISASERAKNKVKISELEDKLRAIPKAPVKSSIPVGMCVPGCVLKWSK